MMTVLGWLTICLSAVVVVVGVFRITRIDKDVE